MRLASRLVVAATVLLVGLIAIAPAAVSARTGPAHVPKVVVIVGPAGDPTSHYLAAGREAAAVARGYTSDVVEVLTPNATWPAVRKALQGASVVVYLGHGNGWPSRYRSSPYPATQNGLGLNPVAGVDDVAHQYFGEAYLAQDVRLAPNAVVVLSHLCYASGNSEPGLPEGTLDVARQRVDNFAAGWIAAGAKAVVAEAYLDPAFYVRALLSGSGTVRSAWNAAPTSHDHVLAFPSARSDGFVDLLDPVSAEGPGFTRSVVLRGSVPTSEVIGNGRGTPGGSGIVNPPTPPAPTLATVGARIAAPTLSGLPTAGVKRTLAVPIELPADAPTSLVEGLQVSVRWTPIDLPAPAPSSGLGPGSATPPSGTPVPTDTTLPVGTSAPAESAAPSGSAAASDDPQQPDPYALVVPETPGDVVDPVVAKRTKAGWEVPTTLPSAAGLYSLGVELHGKDGVALDAATQALVPRLLVRVVGPVSATVVAPAALGVTSGESFSLPVGVRNSGTATWAQPQPIGPRPGAALEAPGLISVSARWLALGADTGTTAGTDGTTSLARTIAPGEQFSASVDLVAPPAPGEWLLLLDVATPEMPSRGGAGAAPTFVRVSVTAPPADGPVTGPRG